MSKARLLLLSSLALLLLTALYQYLSAPVFWQRFTHMLADADKGAYSRVFSPFVSISSNQVFTMPTAPEHERSISEDALDSAVDYAKQFDSFGLLVIHQGMVQLEWYADGFDANTLLQSQSMHKTVQALLFGVALEQGAIESVQQPLSTRLGEWGADSRANITLEHALRMTSGLANLDMSFSPWSSGFRWLYAPDTTSSTLSIQQTKPAGTEFSYNDINAQAMGIFLSRATGRSYADYLLQNLWQPMGGQQARVWLDREDGEAMHACCLLAALRDWGRIGLLMAQQGELNGVQIIPRDWIQKMTTPGELTPHYGYQVWLANNEQANPRATGYQRQENFLDDAVYYLSGYGAQRVYVSEKHQLVVVRMGPASGYLPKILSDWDNAYLPNTIIRGLK